MGCLVGKLTAGGGDPIDGPSAPDAAGDAGGGDHRLVAPPDPRLPPIPSAPQDPSGWPLWLSTAAGDALRGFSPRRADSFQKLDKIGSGTYSNVYKARDRSTGRVVALKKVRVEIGGGAAVAEESVRFMVREIELLRRLNHPNVVRLEGLATSRLKAAPVLYLVFEYLEQDLTSLAAAVRFSEAQVKCFMRQLLSGLEHCHSRGVLHRDIKGSNLLLSREGLLKIADFGLATSYDPNQGRPMTSQVVTLWYRPPELLLGATHYSVGVDLWSVGCVLAELLTGRPLLPGKTEVEQLDRIFKLCGTPSEGCLEKLKLKHMATFKPFKRCMAEKFKDLSPSALSLMEKLLAMDPAERGTAAAALQSEFFSTEPHACDPSSLPQYPPRKEMDATLVKERARLRQGKDSTENSEATKRSKLRNPSFRAQLARDADAKLPGRRKSKAHASFCNVARRFPPAHLDAAIGFPLESSDIGIMKSSTTTDASFLPPSINELRRAQGSTLSGSVDCSGQGVPSSKKTSKKHHDMSLNTVLIGAARPSSAAHLMDPRKHTRTHIRAKGDVLTHSCHAGSNKTTRGVPSEGIKACCFSWSVLLNCITVGILNG